ncbi:hypothetical protein AJ79_02268 [Helicocarpus griseus UAMH5409]|uniref:Uncharacterized protein n=1 Tax=Helicocarpus griseus UAMH5409 TaxID=1447875 RepID=A0A2B7XV74_9EURO|nr:hypothetical protein AJ79_02268 [Helicocarpus griseus UAMH5409]
MSDRRGSRPSDRPEHPPVWVRGGPASYYRPRIVSTPSETLRRASTTSSISSSPDSTAGEPLSPPPSPATSSPPSGSFSSPFPSITTTMSQQSGQSQSGRASSFSPQTLPPFGTSPVPEGPTAPSPRRSASMGGSSLFSRLSSQKRESVDAEMAARRAQWLEQNPNAGPERRRLFSNWWDR